MPGEKTTRYVSALVDLERREQIKNGIREFTEDQIADLLRVVGSIPYWEPVKATKPLIQAVMESASGSQSGSFLSDTGGALKNVGMLYVGTAVAKKNTHIRCWSSC